MQITNVNTAFIRPLCKDKIKMKIGLLLLVIPWAMGYMGPWSDRPIAYTLDSTCTSCS